MANRFFFEIEGRLNTRAILAAAAQVRGEMAKTVAEATRAGSTKGTGGAGGSIAATQVRAEAEFVQAFRAGEIGARQLITALRAVRAEADAARRTLGETFGRTIAAPAPQRVRADVRAKAALYEQDSRRAEAAANRAQVRGQNTPVVRGGIQALDADLPDFIHQGVKPGGAQALNRLLSSAEKLAKVLDAMAANATAGREFGLRLGRAEERAYRQADADAAAAGRETPSEVRTGLTVDRRGREVRENRAFENRMVYEERLEQEMRGLADDMLRRRSRQAQRRVATGDLDAEFTVRAANGEINRRFRENRLGITPNPAASVAERDALIALRADTVRLREQAAALAARTDEEIKAAAASRQTIKLERRRVAQAEVDLRTAELGRGSLTQRAGAFIHNRSGQNPIAAVDAPDLTHLVGGSLLTSARFAVAGGLAYGAISGIRSTITEVDALDLSLAGVRDHLRALGEGDRFKDFRQNILGISRDLGIASDQVANIAVQLVGVFGGDVQRAAKEARAAFKLAVVSGIPQQELADSLTATALAYHTGIESIGDEAVGLETRFGVQAKETLKVFGDFGPVAQEAGLSLRQLGAIAAVVQQRSGRGGQAIAESLSRVLPELQNQAEAIVGLYQATPALAGKAGTVADQIGAGQTGAVLDGLIKDYDKLSSAQQKYLAQSLGGSRNAQTLITLFAGASQYIQETTHHQDNAGRTARRYDEINQSLTRTLARLREQLHQVGIELAGLGFLDAAKIVAEGGLLIVRSIGFAVHILHNLAEVANGLPAKIAGVALALRLLSSFGGGGGGGLGTAARIVSGTGGGGGGALGGILRLLSAGGTAGGIRALIGGLRPTALLGRIGALGANSPIVEGLGLSSTVAGIGTLGLGAAAYGITSHDVNQFNRNRRGARTQQEATERAVRNFASVRALEAIQATGGYGGGSSSLRSNLLSVSPRSQGFRAFFTGTKTQSEVLNNELERRTRQEFEAAAKAGLFANIDPATLKRLEDRVRKSHGGGQAGKSARSLLNGLDAQEYARIQSLLTRAASRKKERDDPGGASELQVRTAAELADAYQAGEVTFATFAEGYQKSIDILQRVAKSGNKDAVARALAAVRTFRQLADQNRQQQLALDQAHTTLDAGAGLGPGAQLGVDRRNAQTALASAQTITNPRDRDLAVTQAQIQLNQIDAQAADLARQTTAARLSATASSTRDPVRKAQVAIQQAAAAMKAAADKKDDVAFWNAYGQYQQAQQDFADQQGTIAESRAALLQARLAHDPLGLARAQLGDANRKLALAQSSGAGEAAVNNAAAAVLNAQNAAADAVQQGIDSTFDLAIAVAEASGNTIEAARKRAEKAQSDLADAQRRGFKGPELDKLKGDAATSQANLQTTLREDRLGDLAWLFEQDKITAGQYIANLQLELAQIPESNKAARREIERRIKQLRDDVGKDFQFNLPTEFRLPTLYAGRRLAQTGGDYYQGSSADNRQVTLTVNAYNATDVDGAVQKFTEVLNQPSRFGTQPSRY